MFGIEDLEASNALLSLAVSPTGLVYAGNLHGLRVCAAAGTEWTPVLPRPGKPPFPVTAVAVSPSNAVFAGIEGGIVACRDGERWSASAFPAPAPVFTAIAVSLDERVMLAGTEEDGVFRSIDGGGTWEPRSFGLLDPCVTAIAFVRDDLILLGSSTGLFTSSNDGKSWRSVRLGPDYDAITNIVVYDGLAWLETETRTWWRSTDLLRTWEHARPVVDRTLSVLSKVIVLDDVPGVYAGLESGEITFLPLRL